MNRIGIIYKSTTGFAEKYARWLSEELQCDLFPYEKRDAADLSAYETIIYGGGIYAGSINGIDWLKSKLPELEGKKVIVYATSAMPPEAAQIKEILAKNLSQKTDAQVKFFYLHSGLAYEKMGFKHKLMMKMFCKMLKKKDFETYQVVRASFDHTSRETLKPLIEYCRE